MKKFFKLLHIVVALSIVLLGTSGTITHASNNDPGAGRLSGDSIPSTFYDNNVSAHLKQYGSTKEKSPYTKTTYTHQDQFDNRTILHGIDVSKWQGKIDWNKVKADGIDYAFIQVGYRGYGNSGILDETTKDPYYDINMQSAIAAGIKVGVYVFSQAITVEEAIEEADYILNAIGDYSISMPLILDYEYASTDSGLGGRLYKAKLSQRETTDICIAFCQEIADAGFTPMVYANKSMLEDQIYADELAQAGYRIWLANYTKNTDYAGTFDFWQYSEKGKVDGIYGDVDMNYYYVQESDNFIPNSNSIFSSDFTEVSNYTYTGEVIAPEVVVTRNGVPLTRDIDYTISYNNNQEIGTATITITGIGTYCNVKRIRFQILPKPMNSPKAKKRSTTSITLSWAKESGIKGYEIYRSTAINGTYKHIKTINKKGTTSYKDTKLTAGTCYYYKIRTFKNVGNKTYYSDLSPAQAIYTKTGYTRNAISKAKTILYDSIPGTKEAIADMPAAESIPIMEAAKNTTFSVLYSTKNAQNKTWYYVSYTTNSTTYKGFVSSNKVTITKLGKVVKTKKVNVRKKSSASSKKLTTLKKNSKVNILSTKKKAGVTWYKVTFKKKNKIYKGWISSPYIKLI